MEPKEISKAVIRQRRIRPVETTTDLKQVIEQALSFIPEKERKEAVKKSCQRSFQALRIDVNSEFEVLYDFLEKLPQVLAPNGRAAILTFHSGEDRLVKKSFKQFYKEGIYSDISKNVIRPSQEECARNSRARSTKMRWAIRAQEKPQWPGWWLGSTSPSACCPKGSWWKWTGPVSWPDTSARPP